MDDRKQFTFYRSYFDAVMQLPQRSRGALLQAIVAYGLDGTEPDTLAPVEKAVFIVVKPTLDAGRKKAQLGKQGGSKGKANSKQTVSKKELKIEKELEVEIKKELEIEIEDKCLKRPRDEKARFDAFWQAYPKKLGKKDAFQAWQGLGVDEPLFARIMDGLERWKRSSGWRQEGGRFIPYAGKWLRERYFEAAPEAEPLTGAEGYLGQAELEAIAQTMAME